MSTPLAPLLRTEVAAKVLGMSVAELRKLRRRGIGPRCVTLGRRVRYSPRHLQEWMNQTKPDEWSIGDEADGSRS